MLDRLIEKTLDGGLPVALMLVALLAGAFALLVTPREEEPQIVVPSADVIIEAPELTARQVERLVATPLEKLLAQIDGVEHVYSTSESGRALVSVSFYVGEDREDSLLKLYSKIYSNQDVVPATVERWVVKPVEVDDVPILTITLFEDSVGSDGYELRRLAEEVAWSLQSVSETNRIEVIGGQPRELRVELQPIAMAGRLTSLSDVLDAIGQSNVRSLAGGVDLHRQQLQLEVDARISSAADLEAMVVNVIDGVPVRLGEVAAVIDGPREPDDHTWLQLAGHGDAYPAVNIAVAKRRGANAVTVAGALEAHLDELATALFPSGTQYLITRNYGETANQKIGDLIASLGVAIIIVVALIGLTLGWRAAFVVALAVPVCYGITLALDYAAGYTINRVTLFALILALGLLVDDPITGVDNIERHLARGASGRRAVLDAIAEMRAPLIMSTVAVVIVFVPMSFITGMMGPYMSPMAFNVPVAVVSSTLVAFLVTPWLGLKLLRPRKAVEVSAADSGLYARFLVPLLERRRNGWLFFAALMVLFVVSALLPLLRVVPLKLLPYDNKNEFQIVIDMPESTTLEGTDAVARDLADFLSGVDGVVAVNGFVGTHAPMDFNGMIRRYYHRTRPHEAELHVVLADRLERPDQSHRLVLGLRPQLAAMAAQHGASIKVVEVPPGPPVVASVVAELYGTPTTSYDTLIQAARLTAGRLRAEPGVVDVDVSAEQPAPRWVLVPDQEKAALSGIGAAAMTDALELLAGGVEAGQVAAPDEASALPIRLTVPYADRSEFGELFVKGRPGITKVRDRGSVADAPTPLVSLAELVERQEQLREQPIYHKDLRPVAYAFAEVAGRVPAAVVYDVDADLSLDVEAAVPLAGRTYFTSGGGIPWDLPEGVNVRWSGEGEWNITLRVFRDLGIAFGVALVGLFFVIRLQTGRTSLTFIIMLAIPLTVIGIMPGFWLLNVLAAGEAGGYDDPILFTATAMIGMIALAGIVVRNSLILVEFVEQARERGAEVREALVDAGRLRARPVLLTAGTTLLGNLVITLDPIFSGLAWAIIFGVAASTLFTLFVVPVAYALAYDENTTLKEDVGREVD